MYVLTVLPEGLRPVLDLEKRLAVRRPRGRQTRRGDARKFVRAVVEVTAAGPSVAERDELRLVLPADLLCEPAARLEDAAGQIGAEAGEEARGGAGCAGTTGGAAGLRPWGPAARGWALGWGAAGPGAYSGRVTGVCSSRSSAASRSPVERELASPVVPKTESPWQPAASSLWQWAAKAAWSGARSPAMGVRTAARTPFGPVVISSRSMSSFLAFQLVSISAFQHFSISAFSC